MDARQLRRVLSETFKTRSVTGTKVSSSTPCEETMTSRRTDARTQRARSLRSLMNVGAAVEGYLNDLGIRSTEQLASQDADELFRRLRARIGRACDPCLHDTFTAIVHEARTGTKTPWFAWTAARKRRVAAGELQLRPSLR